MGYVRHSAQVRRARRPRGRRGPARLARDVGMLGILMAAIAAVVLFSTHATAAQALPATSTPQAGAGSSPWDSTLPSLANTVIHWRQFQYSYELGVGDPANGRVLLGDLWEAIGSDGRPTAYHAIYAYQDGTFHQEIYQTKTTILIILGKDYARTQPVLPGQRLPAGWCVKRGSTTSSAIAADLPLFATATESATIAARAHKARPTEILPNTPSLTGSPALRIHGSSSVVRILDSRSADVRAGTSHSLQLEVVSDGRLLVRHVYDTGALGQVIEDAWTANGSLLVYSPSVVAPSYYIMPQQIPGGCEK